MKKILHDKYIDKWLSEWDSSNKGRLTWKYIKKVNVKKIYSDFYLNQIISGHGIFPAYQAEKFKKTDICLCEQAVGTIEHVINDCELVKDARLKYLTTDLMQKDLDYLLNHRSGTLALKMILKEYYEKNMTPGGR